MLLALTLFPRLLLTLIIIILIIFSFIAIKLSIFNLSLKSSLHYSFLNNPLTAIYFVLLIYYTLKSNN
jgi:hypothetical protein